MVCRATIVLDAESRFEVDLNPAERLLCEKYQFAVTTPRPKGRGFLLLRQLREALMCCPTDACLHKQKRIALPPLIS